MRDRHWLLVYTHDRQPAVKINKIAGANGFGKRDFAAVFGDFRLAIGADLGTIVGGHGRSLEALQEIDFLRGFLRGIASQ